MFFTYSLDYFHIAAFMLGPRASESLCESFKSSVHYNLLVLTLGSERDILEAVSPVQSHVSIRGT